ncbi:carboxylesterase/lipase family protein [Nonomuraea zeae]|uniref:Carboxylic ester hydrolase n=1 Tax=Nonomuraea zeae TaxID=1642303 RepID=A0A5S4GYM4_9ACTN|nr:carboxylesterase family protein [Nonomuraea zeae]TMR37997.1 carboxylesterase family protein [Nonomuraea zeae]
MRHPVETESGLVEGVPGRDPSVTVFRGVPYAAPPVGESRWRPPRPAPPWPGVRRAATFGPMCPQAPDGGAGGAGLPMSEDCLYLNVWTRAAGAGERRPVLVWIHGGGFRTGTGASPRYDGESLARAGLVVITFNYRLGALGFLATPELSEESGHRASGNYGLLDCLAVLRWVRRNVSGFGGDPGRVTIAGQSAGAGTVNFLAMSPLAAGLFHRAVAQSHARHCRDPELRYLATSYRTLAEAELAGARYARERGAPTPALLRSLPWQRLVDGDDAVDAAVETCGPAKPPLFRPVVDGRVIPAGYEETYAEGRQNAVCYLAGNNLDESGAVPESMFTAYRAAGTKTWRPGMPPVHVTLDGYLAAARRRFGALAGEFLRLYPAGTDDEAARAHCASVRDNARVSTFLWAADWSRRARRPVYTYFWTHAAPARGQDPRRAAHGSEIEFVFGNVGGAPEGGGPGDGGPGDGGPGDGGAGWTGGDRRIAEIMSAYWANYSATGDPNGPGLPRWPAFSPDSATVMELGGGFGPIPVADPARLKFWKRFFRTEEAW